MTSLDRRRVAGPEESKPLEFHDELDCLQNEIHKELFENRDTKSIRPIFISTGLISQANGSAYIETQKTKIACAVYGPRQIKNAPYNEIGKINVEVKFAPFSCSQRRNPLRDVEDRTISMLIRQSLTPSIRLDLLPKSCIDIFIMIVENDGIEGCIASGSMVASTALADAGIEMYGLVASCACGVRADEFWFDPTAQESQHMEGLVVLSCMPAVGTVTNVWQTGSMSIDNLLKCMDECRSRCDDIHGVVTAALLDSKK